LRKIFEAEKYLAAIPCYSDNEDVVEQIVKSYLLNEKKSMSPDAMRFLKTNLYGDRFILINELEKLFCYLVDKERIELEDLENVICSSSSSEPDKLCMYFLGNDLANYFKELEKILENNVPSVWVIRALIRYHINVYVCIKK
jgi:DNA polymerase-3 subunit delta